MAAINYFRNGFNVAAAGTPTVRTFRIASARVYAANSTASLIATDVETGEEVLRWATATPAASAADLDMAGYYSQLSFNTVTACSAYFTYG